MWLARRMETAVPERKISTTPQYPVRRQVQFEPFAVVPLRETQSRAHRVDIHPSSGSACSRTSHQQRFVKEDSFAMRRFFVEELAFVYECLGVFSMEQV
jgi:hypothetical protein